MFIFLLWIVVIGVVIYFFWNRRDYFDGFGASSSRSLEILKERYAKGEITKKEYERKKKDLLG